MDGNRDADGDGDGDEEGGRGRRGATLELISRCHTKVKCHLTNVDMLICMQNSEGGMRSCWAEQQQEEEEVMKGTVSESLGNLK